MDSQNEMKLVIPAVSSNEAFARTVVAAFVTQLDPAVDELADVRTAVSEAVTNCIVHAYREAIGYIHILVRLREDRRVVIRVRDYGCGIPDVRQAMEPLFTTGGEERSGLGFSVMESFMDKLRVTSREGKGTTVTMEKRLAAREREIKRL
ncbi:MAG: anti-sigma F factor [Oscillospiraceae bacterium]|nr:anti-sigma F factor [Oscillospiraceae bacterium]